MFKAHTASVRCVDFASDGHSMLTSSDDKSIKVHSHLWNYSTLMMLFVCCFYIPPGVDSESTEVSVYAEWA